MKSKIIASECTPTIRKLHAIRLPVPTCLSTLCEGSPCHEQLVIGDIATLHSQLIKKQRGNKETLFIVPSCFDRIFRITECISEMRIPDNFRSRAKQLFSGYVARSNDISDNYDSLSFLEQQRILSVRNMWTRELSLLNPLRPYRLEGAEPLRVDTSEALPAVSRNSASSDGRPCDFCTNLTAEDTFGVVYGKHCRTASNVAKYAKWHGLLLLKRHDDTFFFDREVIEDMFSVFRQWFRKAHIDDPTFATHHHVMWDYGARASASQPHPHMHLISHPHFLTRTEDTLHAAWDYTNAFPGRQYWMDVVSAHDEAQLAVRYGSCVLLSYMSPIKERELIIVGPCPSSSKHSDMICFARLYFTALHVLRKSGMRAFSSAIIPRPFPPFRSDNDGVNSFSGRRLVTKGRPKDTAWERTVQEYPAVARVVDRGQQSDERSDVGAMEFYGAYSISADPYWIIPHLRAAVDELPSISESLPSNS